MRILVVEDEPIIGGAIKKGLEQESYAVDLATDGASGYDLLATEEYDIVVLDRMLPELDGEQFAAQARRENIQTPILMLTARGELEDKVSGLNAGADDYLTKPFAFEELIARVQALARRPTKTLSTVLSCDGVTLNTLTHEVKRQSTIVDLSKKEYALLEYLLRMKNQTVSKENIISHVWNYDADVLPNTVEVYIGYLRTKIDKAFGELPPLIHTVRGFGYTIREKK